MGEVIKVNFKEDKEGYILNGRKVEGVYVDTLAATLIGAAGGLLVVFSIITLDKLRIDDPVGAISVHGTVGIWGVLAVAIFGAADLLPQIVGVVAIVVWTFTTSFVAFKALDLVMGIRVTAAEEHAGLDRSEHGGEAYPEFVFQETVAPPELLDPVGSDFG